MEKKMRKMSANHNKQTQQLKTELEEANTSKDQLQQRINKLVSDIKALEKTYESDKDKKAE